MEKAIKQSSSENKKKKAPRKKKREKTKHTASNDDDIGRLQTVLAEPLPMQSTNKRVKNKTQQH